jgi:outer membrane protein OmpA-like peptidoglycan-associated protein
MNNNRFWLFIMAVALVISGCAGPKTLVVIAPDKDGKVGAVSLTTPQGEKVLDKAYAAASADKEGGIEAVPMTEQGVKAVFSDALNVRPDPPLSFTIYFREGTDELTPESKLRLADVLKEISRRGSKISEVTVVGHTDRVGKLEFNDRLSLKRAQRVVDELVNVGVARESISAAGRGEREPVIQTEDEVAEPRNRRVEVSVR